MHIDNELHSGTSIVVLIDCWENSINVDVLDTLTKNILSTVPTIPNLGAVILSSYDTDDYLIDNLYYKNSKDLFYLEQPIDSIKRWYMQTLIDASSQLKSTTDAGILHRKWECPQYAMFNELQLEYYINHVVSDVRNIYFFGMSWSMCVRSRSIGWESVSKLIKFNHLHENTKLYTIENCVLDADFSDADDNLDFFFPKLSTDDTCTHVVDNTYRINF